MHDAPPILDYGRGGGGGVGGGPPGEAGSRLAGVLAAVALVPVAWVTLGVPPMPFSPLLRLLSGRLFRDRVVPYEANVFDTLTPLVIRDFFYYFAVIAVPTLLYLAALRWASDRGTEAGRRAFAWPAAATCACLLVLLTVPFAWLVRYTTSMGVTQARLNGLACGIAAYAVIVAFAWWCVRPRRG